MKSFSFKATHSYTQSKIGIEIPIELTSGSGHTVKLRAKVDTGASCCIFQRDYAEALDIDLEHGEPKTIATATGTFLAYGHELTMSCLDWEFNCTVYFAEPAHFRRNAVGRAGWLQRFRLAIIDHDSVLHLSDYDD